MDNLYNILIIIIFLAALFYLLYLLGGDSIVFFRNRQKATDDDASAKMLPILKRYARLNKFEYLENVTLFMNGESAHYDCILLGDFGVIILNACGRAGDLYGEEKEATWIQRFGNERTSFANPLLELPPATRLVRNALFNDNLRPKVLDAFIVFTAKKVSVNLPKDATYMMGDTLGAEIDKSRYLELNGFDAVKAREAIEKYIVK